MCQTCDLILQILRTTHLKDQVRQNHSEVNLLRVSKAQVVVVSLSLLAGCRLVLASPAANEFDVEDNVERLHNGSLEFKSLTRSAINLSTRSFSK